MMPSRSAWLVMALVLLFGVEAWAEPPATIELDAELRERCLTVIRAGLTSDQFWPAMHAAEALTLAGHGDEVLRALASRTAQDDQQQCGLAREAVRAGDRRQIHALLEILIKPGSNGHIHAAESLFKVAEVGDGRALRAALAQSEDLRLKLMAAAALARAGHPRALDDVRAQLKHDDREIRKVAVWILGQLGQQSDIAGIRACLSREDDALARAYCANALACLGDAEGKRLLAENLAAEDPAVRTYAADFAGYARNIDQQAKLAALLGDKKLDVRVRAAQSLIALSLPPSQLGLPIAIAKEDLARDVYAATAEHPRYSEGSIAVLTDGSLLFATTEFVGGGADHATARIIARVSRDGGRTWGKPRVLQENVGKQNVMSATLRRLMPGRHDGPLGLVYLVKNGPNDLKAYLRISTDEARTFGEPILITDAPGYHVMNNDRLTVLTSGRLVCPVAWTDDVHKPGRGHFVSWCYLSDDGGRIWRRSAGQVDQPQRGAMEPGVIELNDGNVLMIVRTQLGHVATSRSTDGGDHWSEPAALSVKSPEAPATIRRIPATGDLLLLWNNSHQPGAGHGGPRTPLTAAISSDEGQTWRHVRNLETNPDQGFAYTSVLFVRDRLLLSYYVSEKGRISSRFRSLPVSWLYESP
ncbi:MAG: exo-alpha-sialidase [Pirellulaceae bacterium]